MPSTMLSSHFRTVFEDVLTPVQQLQAINSLKDYTFELEHGTDEQRRELDIISDDDVDSDMVNKKVSAALERCYWQLVMLLRSCRPTRISEAEPYLRVLVKSPTVTNDSGNFHTINTNLHLAAALAASAVDRQRFSYRRNSSRQSQVDEALSLFSHSFASYDTPASPASDSVSSSSGLSIITASPSCLRRRCLPPKTELWARASYIRLLRTLNRVEEANCQLERVKVFIQSHPYALPAGRYCAFIKDLSLEFGLELEVAEEDPIRLVIPADSVPTTYDSEPASPTSPTLSLPSSSSTYSDSSPSSSPSTPISVLPPPSQMLYKDGCDASEPADGALLQLSHLC